MSDLNKISGAVITGIEGMKSGSGEVRIVTDKGTLRLFHYQDCCESVYVNDVTGDPADLIGAKVLELREDTKDNEDCSYGDQRWTFYNLVTDKADTTIRWSGSSNGYYSIAVSSEWTEVAPASPEEPEEPGSIMGDIRVLIQVAKECEEKLSREEQFIHVSDIAATLQKLIDDEGARQEVRGTRADWPGGL